MEMTWPTSASLLTTRIWHADALGVGRWPLAGPYGLPLVAADAPLHASTDHAIMTNCYVAGQPRLAEAFQVLVPDVVSTRQARTAAPPASSA